MNRNPCAMLVEFACANFMKSMAFAPTGVGEFVIRKSCVCVSSALSFGPGTPISFTAIPRASSLSSVSCQPTPLE